MYEIDHVLLCTSVGALEANRVIEIGFSEGSSNRHPGQGTANRRIFFDTTMLEFLWVEEGAAAQSAEVQQLGLWERWYGRTSGACPFGVCLRASDDARQEPPFPTWQYQPAYSPVAIEVGINSQAVDEPFLFYIPIARKQREASARQVDPTGHAIGVRDVTGLEIWHPAYGHPSLVMEAVAELGIVTFAVAPEFLMHLSFDHNGAGKSSDFRPEIPLILSW